MVRLVTIDGRDFGVLYHSQPDQYGNTAAIVVKNEWLERYYINDPKRGAQLLERLINEAKLDPKNKKVLVALLRKNYDRIVIPPQSILNLSASNPDVFILLMDEKGRPVPLDVLLSNSQVERDRLAKLFNYYNAFVHFVYPKMVREIDLYRQTVKAYQLLLNTRDHEVNALLESNTRAMQIMKNAQATIHTLTAQISMLEQLLELSSKEADKWREAATQAITEVMPKIHTLLRELANEIAAGLTSTMQYHATELSRSEAIKNTVNELLKKIKELESEYMKAVAEATKQIRTPPKFELTPEQTGGEEVGSPESGEEKSE